MCSKSIVVDYNHSFGAFQATCFVTLDPMTNSVVLNLIFIETYNKTCHHMKPIQSAKCIIAAEELLLSFAAAKTAWQL